MRRCCDRHAVAKQAARADESTAAGKFHDQCDDARFIGARTVDRVPATDGIRWRQDVRRRRLADDEIGRGPRKSIFPAVLDTHAWT